MAPHRIPMWVARWRLASTAIIVAGVALLVTPICGALFACGCDWPWRGLAERCNYFQRSLAVHCPWCEYRTLGIGTPLVAMAIAARVATWSRFFGALFRRSGFDSLICGSLGLALAVALLFVLGQSAFTATGYPRPQRGMVQPIETNSSATRPTSLPPRPTQ